MNKKHKMHNRNDDITKRIERLNKENRLNCYNWAFLNKFITY